jgi:hypothetical protein
MEHTQTKFLIYTRGGTDENSMKIHFEQTYPFLKGRLDVMRLEGGSDARWDGNSGRELKLRVKSLLGLD